MKYFLILLLTGCLFLNISCSSNSEEADLGASSEATDELAEESADALDDAFSGGSDMAMGDEGSDDVQADLGGDNFDEFGDDLADEGLESTGEQDEFALEEPVATETDELDIASEDMGQSKPESDELATMDEAPSFEATEPEPSTELGAFNDMPADTGFGSGDMAETGDQTSGFGEAESFDSVGDAQESVELPVQKVSWVSVKKIKSIPFTKNSKLMNTVYILRQGDTPSQVAQQVYGSSNVEQIYEDNPHLRKSFKQGDKLYFNSSSRPNDGSRVLTFYEDRGIPAKTFFARSGQNIRKISSELIGGSGAWKEIYATNPAIESKSSLLNDAEIVYWPSGEMSGMALAQNNNMEIPEPMMEEPNLVDPPVAQALPPINNRQEDNNLAAPGTVAAMPTPPTPPMPPTMDMTPPPPPAPPAMNSGDMAMAEKPSFAQERAAQRAQIKKNKPAAGNDDLMITLGAVLVAAGGGLFLIVKKSKAKKMKMDITEQTQI